MHLPSHHKFFFWARGNFPCHCCCCDVQRGTTYFYHAFYDWCWWWFCLRPLSCCGGGCSGAFCCCYCCCSSEYRANYIWIVMLAGWLPGCEHGDTTPFQQWWYSTAALLLGDAVMTDFLSPIAGALVAMAVAMPLLLWFNDCNDLMGRTP